ncbi:ABC transporter ATP-binding protein [Candidatus Halobeggiatoa sp. HSG11]|nr:ABC transporter ATP-binding protein [Candidatus Halobeggiatoa sp. HSG11]
MSKLLSIIEMQKKREQGGISFELNVPTFNLQQGQFVAIVGASGCGKSSLLDILALVLRPSQCKEFLIHTASEIMNITEIWKHEAKLATIRRNIFGYVLQTGGLLPFLTVERNIYLPIKVKHSGYSTEDIYELAKKMGVEQILTKKPQYLSGGQRQRVAILRAMAHKPNIILADEPTAAVDKENAHIIVKNFYSLAKESGTTIVMVTHDHDLVAELADITYTFKVKHESATATSSVLEVQA